MRLSGTVLLSLVSLVLFQAGPALAERVPLFTDTGFPTPLVLERGGERMTIENEGDRWWVSAADGSRQLADADGAQALIDRVQQLTTVRRVARYGFPQDEAFANATTIRRGRQQVTIGGESRIPGLVYVRLSNGDLYLMQPVSLSLSAAKLVDRQLFPGGLGKTREISLTGSDTVVHATKKFGDWRLSVPESSAADGKVVDAWLGAISSLTGDPAPGGMPDGDAYNVVLTDENGKKINFLIYPGELVAMDGVAFQADPTGQDLLPDRFAWMVKEVIQVAEAPLTGIRVSQAEKTITFARDERGKWVEKDTGLVFRSWTDDLFAHMNPLPAIGIWEGDLGAMGEPQVVVRLWKGSKVVDALDMWMTDDRWWARRGDSVFVFEISDKLPEHLSRIF